MEKQIVQHELSPRMEDKIRQIWKIYKPILIIFIIFFSILFSFALFRVVSGYIRVNQESIRINNQIKKNQEIINKKFQELDKSKEDQFENFK